MRAKIIIGMVLAALGAALVASMAVAQPGGGAPAGGGRGGQRDMREPGEMRRAMTDRMREQIGATDEEWTVIEPKLRKVMDLNRQLSRAGRMGMAFGGQGRRQGRQTPDTEREPTAVEKASDELQTVLDNESATDEQVKAKLGALREAREKVTKELLAAQKELKQAVSAKQEAALALMGQLD